MCSVAEISHSIVNGSATRQGGSGGSHGMSVLQEVGYKRNNLSHEAQNPKKSIA